MNIFHRNTPSHRFTSIVKTGFYTSLATYTLLLLADAMRPGFVARYFSPHIFFLTTVFFAYLWLRRLETYQDRVIFQLFGTGILAIISSVIVWSLGKGFASYRILMVLIALLIPFAILSLIRHASD